MLLASNDELMEQYLTDASGFTAGGSLRESIEDRAKRGGDMHAIAHHNHALTRDA